ncbi:MAG TPA: CopG family antitoxin [Silvibacterium sp.]|nr:CopG family antitoxin [Silvibacterium sp.]
MKIKNSDQRDPKAGLKKKIPAFQSEEEEFEFWSKTDTTEYLEWSKAERVKFPNLKRQHSC